MQPSSVWRRLPEGVVVLVKALAPKMARMEVWCPFHDQNNVINTLLCNFRGLGLSCQESHSPVLVGGEVLRKGASVTLRSSRALGGKEFVLNA